MDSMKRALSSDATNSPPFKKPTIDNATSTAPDDRTAQLGAVLRVGIFEFLSTRDTAVLLSCSRTFWYDNELATVALHTGSASEHFDEAFGRCTFDWFQIMTESDEEEDSGGEEEEDSATADESDSDDGGNEDRNDNEDGAETGERPQETAQLISLIAAFEKFIFPLELPDRFSITSYADIVFDSPVAISLWEHHPNPELLQHDHEWTCEDVRLALNGARDGLGDLFADTDLKFTHTVDISAHWECIQMSTSATNRLECVLCEKYKYLKAAFNASARGDKIALAELQASPLDLQYAHCNASIEECTTGEDDAEWYNFIETDAVKQLPWPLSDVFDCDQVIGAMDDDYDAMLLCRSYLHPLKQFLLDHCTFVKRIEFPTPECHEYEIGEYPLWGENGKKHIELLAGVTTSGFF